MAFDRLLQQMEELRVRALTLENTHREDLDRVAPEARASARNLLHYLALRQEDLRPLQSELSRFGLSSLGRSEARVLSNLDRVTRTLSCLAGRATPSPDRSDDPTCEADELSRNTVRLLGHAPGREVRIMVTMPSEAATSYELVRDLVTTGMNVMRINCAHDDASCWAAMTANLRRAHCETNRQCRIEVDLAGPKVRTGRYPSLPGILRFKPQRDYRGEVMTPIVIALHSPDSHPPIDDRASLPVAGSITSEALAGDRIALRDVRGRKRTLEVFARQEGVVLTQVRQGVWVESGTRLDLIRNDVVIARGEVATLPPVGMSHLLGCGSLLHVTHPDRALLAGDDSLPTVTCTAPEVFADVRAGERIWFDDGKIGGVINRVAADGLEVCVTHAKPGGAWLGPDKGINLPDSKLTLPALTDQDLADLEFVAAEADLVALSFLHEPEDLLRLEQELDLRSAPPHLGIVLKIETRRAFENLPRLLLTAMASPPVGVMIARGDLGVEVGFERLAEVQEEILWLCEAAHVPVIWATQVLETLAKTGRPSRAEVTDAAMAVRAECVMLNKGPHVVEAVRFLDNVLERMGQHQHKKRQLLRRLKISEL